MLHNVYCYIIDMHHKKFYDLFLMRKDIEIGVALLQGDFTVRACTIARGL
jgi:hypothetical protein